MKISTGSGALDELLSGGVETGAVTQIFGEGGSGKTNLAIQFAEEAARCGKVAFIDTEGFPVERYEQVVGGPEVIAEELLLYEPKTLEEQHSAVKDVDRIADRAELSAVVVDSVAPFYRVRLGEDLDVRRDLSSQLTFLTGVSREHELAVLVTNQVYTDVETGEKRPLGGNMMNHLSKTIVKLEKIGASRRRAVLEKHRSLPEGSTCYLRIGDEGIRD